MLSTHVDAANSVIDQEREQAVQSIRQGNTEQGVAQLAQLRSKYPEDQKILADYLLVELQAGRFNDSTLSQLQEINVHLFPQYAQMSLLYALRDLKRFKLALELAEKFYTYKSSNDLGLMLGGLYAEDQQIGPAKLYLDLVSVQELNVSQLVQGAYAYRRIGDLIQALDWATMARLLQPHSDEVLQQYYPTLLALESSKKALADAEQDLLKVKNTKLYHQIKQAYFAQNIRYAIDYLRYKKNWTEQQPYLKLDQVLAEMSAYAQDIDLNDKMFNTFYYDYIYALSVRGHSQEAIDWLNKTNKNVGEGYFSDRDIPNYTRHAIADAYLALRKPKHAEQWYKSLLDDQKYLNFEVYTGLYYSYIEQEEYFLAEKLLSDLDHQLPRLQYSDAKGSNPWVHPDRASYIELLGLNQAYSNRLKQAEQYYQDLLTIAPNNDSYINQLAMIQRWRDKPLQANKTLARLNGLQPVSKSQKLNHMQNAQALGDVKTWRNALHELKQIDPEDTGVMKSAIELQERDRPSIVHHSEFGRSRTKQGDSVHGIQGLSDRNSKTQLYSPWFLSDQFRILAQYTTRWSEYRDGVIHENRYALGGEWSAYRKTLTALLSENELGQRAGVNIQWSHWLNDHWSYRFGFDSAADIPLQAIQQNHNGQSYSAGLTWKQDSSRRASADYQWVDINDGNTRQELQLNFNQGLWYTPHQTSQVNISAYYGKNNLPHATYFNPRNHYSLDFNWSHDWLTWRNYERLFNQHFELGIGIYSQRDYTTLPTYAALYRHEWQVTKAWKLHYGIGWQRHPYDGQQEQRTHGVIGFEGKF
ncbi:poly-beta-1,6 N-acetyl-D-glucosamine export porin PgaA [Acinetobacter suaedae]|uniref:poly-beta-1,6 N-acetyl-D-glucosamine export porin PgaA n=1 Tax=Acinetobacter suaedae TaxID=2609668 RepID=UPI00148F43E9|nr:poly-beta-1,6 N-acetyl-D-glucosamine export porin PgaA [Acinetobacter sp. C16S1]